MADSPRVLVTGGAGFIGSHVADALVERGYLVGVLDSLANGHRANVPAAADFFEADISDAAAVARVFGEFRPQLVSHHAAQISVAASANDPVADAQANVIGSLVVLEACRAHGVDHVVFASTGGALYGDPATVPADEQSIVQPLSPYGAAKASVETYLRTYKATWGLSYTALRYANVYGPRQTADGEAGVIAIFANHLLRGERPTVFGDGEQQRDFVYVGDVTEANLLAIEQRLQGSYNVGTGVGTSVNQIAAALVKLCGYAGIIDHAPERAGEVRRVTLDASLLQRMAGWRAQVSLEAGLGLTVDDRKARMSVSH